MSTRILHEERLRGVHPNLVTLTRVWASECPWPILIVEGVRTAARQLQLYQQGRTEPGPMVTNANTLADSAHGRRWVNGVTYGCAIDAVPCSDAAGKGTWVDVAGLTQMGLIAERLGIVWGGRWKRFPDSDHFQLKGWRDFPAAPDPTPPDSQRGSR